LRTKSRGCLFITRALGTEAIALRSAADWPCYMSWGRAGFVSASRRERWRRGLVINFWEAVKKGSWSSNVRPYYFYTAVTQQSCNN